MIKQGVVTIGTPSVASGKPSDHIEDGDALCEGEKLPKRPQDLKVDETAEDSDK